MGNMTRLSWMGKSFFFLLSQKGKGKLDLFFRSGKIFVDFSTMPDRIRETWPVCHERGNFLLWWFSFYAWQDMGNMFVMSGKIFIVLDFSSMPNRIRETWPVCHEWENLYCVDFSSMLDRIWETWPICHERENLYALDFPSMPDRISETWPVCHERENLYCVRFSF